MGRDLNLEPPDDEAVLTDRPRRCNNYIKIYITHVYIVFVINSTLEISQHSYLVGLYILYVDLLTENQLSNS